MKKKIMVNINLTDIFLSKILKIDENNFQQYKFNYLLKKNN